MNKTTAIDLVVARSGRFARLRDTILTEMELAMQATLCTAVFTPWFCVGELSTGSTLDNQERVAVPSDFLKELDERPLEIFDARCGRFIKLIKKSYEWMEEKFGSDNFNFPTHYSLDGLYFRLRPIPPASYPLRMIYHKIPGSIITAETNEWLTYSPDLVIAETARVMAGKHLQNTSLEASCAADVTAAWNRLVLLAEARDQANHEYQMGEPV